MADMTNYERTKNMSVEEMAKFLKSMVDDNETHEVACYGCINYGTHHSDPQNKGTNIYECEGCYCEGIGHDLVKWLNLEVVRCNDCKFFYVNNDFPGGRCELTNRYYGGLMYCAHGERKEGEDNGS